MSDDCEHSWESGGPAEWDEELAETLRGAYVLIGVTYQSASGEIESRAQMHGRISVVDRERGILIALEGARAGDSFHLPPSLASFHAAAPGEYRLKSTGEVVVDPDYTSSWTITRPAKT